MDKQFLIQSDNEIKPFEANLARIDQLNWNENLGWYTYPFNLGGEEFPANGEVHAFDNAQVRITLVNNIHYFYQASQGEAARIGLPAASFKGTMVLFCCASPNAGHFLSEIISFAEFYMNLDCCVRVGVPVTLRERTPLMFQILRDICPGIRLVPLLDKTSYGFERLVTRRNSHFIMLKNWHEYQYKANDNILCFDNLGSIVDSHSEPLNNIMRFTQNVFSDNKHTISRSKKIFVIKRSDDRYSLSPGRGLFVEISAIRLAEARGFEFISIADFKDNLEYVCTIRRATHVVFSYGAITCCNRFFLGQDAAVVLLANSSYSKEYNSGHDFSHIRYSHLCPVRSQRVILDFPDFINEEAMQHILDQFDI